MKVLLSAGHSNVDPGATKNGYTESAIAVEMRNLVASLLRSRGVEVVTDGNGLDNLPLSDAIKLIAGKHIAVELHCNSVDNVQANGVECIALPANKIMAQRLASVTAGVLGVKLRGDGGYIGQEQSARGTLGFVKHGGFILELFFLSNAVELDRYQRRKAVLAQALADTICVGVGNV